MEEVRTPPSMLEKSNAEFQALALSIDFVGALLGTVPTCHRASQRHTKNQVRQLMNLTQIYSNQNHSENWLEMGFIQNHSTPQEHCKPQAWDTSWNMITTQLTQAQGTPKIWNDDSKFTFTHLWGLPGQPRIHDHSPVRQGHSVLEEVSLGDILTQGEIPQLKTHCSEEDQLKLGSPADFICTLVESDL